MEGLVILNEEVVNGSYKIRIIANIVKSSRKRFFFIRFNIYIT